MPRFMNLLLAIALVFVVLVGMHAGATILSAFILAVALAQVMSPTMAGLVRRGWPSVAAFVAVFALTLLVGLAAAVFVGVSLEQVAKQIPFYAQSIVALVAEVAPAGMDTAMQFNLTDRLLNLGSSLVATIGELAGMAALTFVFFGFMLWDSDGISKRLRSAGPRASRVLQEASVYQGEVRRFLTVTATVGVVVGGLIAASLWLVGVRFAVVWGLLFIPLSFIPGIGLTIAAIPPVALAFVQFGMAGGLIVLAGIFLITTVLQQFLKPRYLGQGLGLSYLAIYISIVVWGAVLGPVGTLLAVPLTLLVKKLLESFDETRWFAVLISNRPAEPQSPEAVDPEPPGQSDP